MTEQPAEEPIKLMPGDVFLTKGTSFLSRAIRIFTRSRGESVTQVNHVGLVVQPGTINGAREPMIVEALSRVKLRGISAYQGSKTQIAIYRHAHLTEGDRSIIAAKASSYVGRDYGYVKIVAHFLDWCLGGRFVFRRIARMDDYPICSWLVAYSYLKVGHTFGVRAAAASPDDIWDYIVANPELYVPVFPLGKLPSPAYP